MRKLLVLLLLVVLAQCGYAEPTPCCYPPTLSIPTRVVTP
jgi:hypothetical protein